MICHFCLILTYDIKGTQALLTQAIQIKVSHQKGLNKQKKESKCRRSFMSSNAVLFSFPLFVPLLSFMPLLMKCFLPPPWERKSSWLTRSCFPVSFHFYIIQTNALLFFLLFLKLKATEEPWPRRGPTSTQAEKHFSFNRSAKQTV